MVTTSFVRSGVSSLRPSRTEFKGTISGANGVTLVSTGVADMDRILGGGLPLGTVLLLLEDAMCPLHLLLMRCFLAQGLVHQHSLLFASSLPQPSSFILTIPPAVAGHSAEPSDGQDEQSPAQNLRIAFQYRRFVSEQDALEARRQQQLSSSNSPVSSQDGILPRSGTTSSFSRSVQKSIQSSGTSSPYCSDFDLRKTADRAAIASTHIDCVPLGPGSHGFAELDSRLRQFLGDKQRVSRVARVTVQSLGSSQSQLASADSAWDMLRWLFNLKAKLRDSQAAAMVTFPLSLFSPAISCRVQHMADAVISLHALKEEDKLMSDVIADYSDAVGLVKIIKLPSVNTMAPKVPETSTYVAKALRRRKIVFQTLQQIPVDASAESSKGSKSVASVLCSGPQNSTSSLDF